MIRERGLTGDWLTVFVLNHSGSWIWLSDFRFGVRVAASGHVGNAVWRVKHRSVARRRWGRIPPLRLGVFFVEKLRRDVRERLMGHSHITFSNVQRFHELLRCPVQIFQRDLYEGKLNGYTVSEIIIPSTGIKVVSRMVKKSTLIR